MNGYDDHGDFDGGSLLPIYWEETPEPARRPEPRGVREGGEPRRLSSEAWEGEGSRASDTRQERAAPPAAATTAPAADRGAIDFRDMSPRDLTRAFVLGEVLGPPLALRGRRGR